MTTLERKEENISMGSIRGLASGVIFLAIFSTLWAQIGIMGLQGWGGSWLSPVTLLAGLALLLGSISLLRTSRKLPIKASGSDVQKRKKQTRWFRIITITEGLMIFAAVIIFNALHRIDLLFPVIALIVGLHFFPLAAVFQEKIYSLSGVVLCALVVITLLAVPERTVVSSSPVSAWEAILGFCFALILWGDGFILWLQGKRLLTRLEQ